MLTTEVVEVVAVPLLGQTTGRAQPQLHYMSISQHETHAVFGARHSKRPDVAKIHQLDPKTPANPCWNSVLHVALEIFIYIASCIPKIIIKLSVFQNSLTMSLRFFASTTLCHDFLLFLSILYTPVVPTCSERTRPFSPTRSAAYTWRSVRDRRFANAPSVSL